MTHLGTWMLLVDKPDLVASLLPHTGPKSLPMTLTITAAGEEFERHLYSKLTVKEFLEQMSELTGIEVAKLKVEHVDDFKKVRLDLLLYEKETAKLPVDMRTLNTLRDVSVAH